MESITYTPSLAQDIRSGAIMAAVVIVATPFLCFTLRSGRVHSTTMSFRGMMITGICLGLAVFLGFLGRFLWKAPKSVEISDRGATLKFRGGRMEEIAWDAVTAASLTSDAGMKWELKGANSTLLVRDDGFSSREWGRVSRSIAERLKPRGVEITSDKEGAPYLQVTEGA